MDATTSFLNDIHKVKKKNIKQTKDVGLMGAICSNCHRHKNNQIYKIS
jgi:hypothetical protein